MTEVSDGQQVRTAYDGPDLDHDQLIDQIEARNHEDAQRASSAGESRQKIGEFLDETNMNSKAFAFCRMVMKTNDKKGQAEAMDIIRSTEDGLAMVKNHVAGQGTAEMDLEGPQDETETEEEPVEEPQPEVQDEETADFNAAVDANMSDDVVTPIDFGGDVA